jgi:hypothetical protein
MGDNFLQGRDAIAEFTGRRWAVILRWIREKGFPATKLGGVWESEREMITQWRREQIRKAKEGNK